MSKLAVLPSVEVMPDLQRPHTNKTQFDQKVVCRLLDMLSTSDEYRELFTTDPMGALIEAGHIFSANVREGGLGEVHLFPGLFCFLVGELASKEEISETRDLIQSYLMSNGTHQVVHAFEAGKITSTLKLKG